MQCSNEWFTSITICTGTINFFKFEEKKIQLRERGGWILCHKQKIDFVLNYVHIYYYVNEKKNIS